MSYLFFGLGLVLAACGAASISFGYGIINVERGWASVIGGAAALSGGIVTMALATILHSLSRLRAFLRDERDARAKAAAAPWQAEPRIIEAAGAQAPIAPWQDAMIAPLADAGVSAESGNPAPEGGPTLAASGQRAETAAAPVAKASIEDIRRVVAETIKSKPQTSRPEEGGALAGRSQARAEPAYVAPAQQVEAAVEQVQRRRAPPLSFGLPRAVGLKEIPQQPFDAAQAPVVSARSAVDSGSEGTSSIALEKGRREAEPASNLAASRAPAAPPAESAAERRPDPAPGSPEERFTVIGRYESEGTTYVMFADGSIEARTERGAFHFTSMAELKVFMDSQARGE